MKEQNYGDSQYKFRGRGAGGRKGRTWGAEKILRAVKLQLLTPTDPARPTWSADGTLCLAGNNVSIRVLFTTSGTWTLKRIKLLVQEFKVLYAVSTFGY